MLSYTSFKLKENTKVMFFYCSLVIVCFFRLFLHLYYVWIFVIFIMYIYYFYLACIEFNIIHFKSV